jgi:murein DD-endopeptidase MepM/ murein hydrolase activator NlpD
LKNKIIKAYSNGEIVKNITTDDWRTHNALDIEGKSGESVVSICDGIVIEVTHDALWGTTVVIDHGNGYTAKYCGLKKDSVPELNSQIKSNQKIGVLDEIPMESADGIHLHFEMYKDGKNVSPIKYLGNEITI